MHYRKITAAVLCAAAVFGENPDSTGADPSKEVAAVILHTIT